MEPPEKIGNMDAILFALTLEVVLMQIRILESSTELHSHLWNVATKSQEQQRAKLVRERETVADVIRRTLIEVAETGEWHSLQNAVSSLKNQAQQVVSKRKQYEELRRSKITIVDELDSKRQQWSMELRSANLKTAILRDKINDEQLNANARLAYAEKWNLAQAESLSLQYEQPRAPLPRMEHEERVHQELKKAYDIQIKERQESLKYWEKRYTVDTKDMDRRLAAKVDELRVATKHHTERQKLYDLHAAEINAWLTFKREREERIAYEEHLRASAMRIQAWWRGLMVRRCLGQFKFLRNIKKPANKNKKK